MLRAIAASAARAWVTTPSRAASNGDKPWASSPPISPASTSPVPPVASAALACGQTARYAARIGDRRERTLGDEHHTPRSGEPQRLRPGRLAARPLAGQPRQLTAVWRDDGRCAKVLPPAGPLGERVERIGVDHRLAGRRVASARQQQLAHEVDGRVGPAQAGAEDERVRVRQHRPNGGQARDRVGGGLDVALGVRDLGRVVRRPPGAPLRSSRP